MPPQSNTPAWPQVEVHVQAQPSLIVLVTSAPQKDAPLLKAALERAVARLADGETDEGPSRELLQGALDRASKRLNELQAEIDHLTGQCVAPPARIELGHGVYVLREDQRQLEGKRIVGVYRRVGEADEVKQGDSDEFALLFDDGRLRTWGTTWVSTHVWVIPPLGGGREAPVETAPSERVQVG